MPLRSSICRHAFLFESISEDWVQASLDLSVVRNEKETGKLIFFWFCDFRYFTDYDDHLSKHKVGRCQECGLNAEMERILKD